MVEQLRAHGLRFRTVTMQTEGEYQPIDVDWNNKDIPHLNHIHEWVNDVTCVAERDFQASVSLQKVLGIPFPVVLVHYDTEPGHQAHFFTLLAWTVVTDIEFVNSTPTRTRATTSYTVGSSRFWMLFFPVIRALLRRNYRQLMAEDVPMRERRGLLRSWGYTFRGDGATRDLRDSIPIGRDNVVPPDPVDLGATAFPPVPLAELTESGWAVVGRSDHLGLKFQRKGRSVLAYARMCPHEGADLDPAPAVDGCLTCPWHGRRLEPVAVLDLDAPDATAETPWHRLRIEADHLHVTLSGTGSGPLLPTRSDGSSPAAKPSSGPPIGFSVD